MQPHRSAQAGERERDERAACEGTISNDVPAVKFESKEAESEALR